MMMHIRESEKSKMLPAPRNRLLSEFSDTIIQFNPEEIKAMTRKFSAKKRVADKRFASVYKCSLPHGENVAVKHLKPGALQQEFFMAEIDRIKCVRHPNLIPLLGYCSTGGFQTLVFDFAQNKNISHHLHGTSGLSWDIRVKIVTGVAQALIHMHDRGFIHRDIKPSNILLNKNFVAQVADFGCTNLSLPYLWSRKIEDPEYIAPEYGARGILTVKSDVYSFGVVLLEILSGRTLDAELLNEYDGMVTWGKARIADALEKDDFSKLVDPKLHGVYDKSMVYKMVKVIAQSVVYDPENRPTMKEVLETLVGETDFSYRLIRRAQSLSRDKLYASLKKHAQKSVIPFKSKKSASDRTKHDDPLATSFADLSSKSVESDDPDDPVLRVMLLRAVSLLKRVKRRE